MIKVRNCWGDSRKKTVFERSFFYPIRRIGISSPREVRCISSALRAVSHHAPACIYLRLDDIHGYAMMICNPCGIDDIHACGVIFIELQFCPTSSNKIRFRKKADFVVLFTIHYSSFIIHYSLFICLKRILNE